MPDHPTAFASVSAVVDEHAREGNACAYRDGEEREAEEDVDGEEEARQEEDNQAEGPDGDGVWARDVWVSDAELDDYDEHKHHARDGECV
eukprot:CAMPEP_0114143072 /NCGR_PEP_ID=MMETSP0043_2-20121206/18787_1 /TAXON_ID=464988 /ORGANISM="Hemiselmis andersenii, Strain CCMP644" /LENGTH=89 /DNA_ID=CAMNT_0001237337 /DNA_START=113 /DNA_END=381 /DNA_ORIENTATION=-